MLRSERWWSGPRVQIELKRGLLGCRMNDNIDKLRVETITRRRMLQVGAVATATLLVPGIALADDWIRVNSVPLTSTVPGRSSIMKARPVVPQVEARYQTVGYTPPQPRDTTSSARWGASSPRQGSFSHPVVRCSFHFRSNLLPAWHQRASGM